MDFCTLVDGMGEVPGARNDTGGRGGRGPRCKWSVEWHGRSRIHANSIYFFLAVLSFAIYREKMSCRSCGLGLDLEIAKSELTTRRLDAPPTPASDVEEAREARTFF